MRYGVLVLAGGYSRRFHSDKRLASVDGEPMLVATLKRVQLALADFPRAALQVVIRARDPLVSHLLSQRGLSSIHAPPWPVGVGASIAAGAQALLNRVPTLDVIAVVPADMPQLRAESLAGLLQHSRREAITVPVCLGEPGEIIVVGADFFPEMLCLPVRHGLKKLLRDRADRVRHQVVDDTALIRSINSPADFQAAIRPGPADKNFGIPRRDLRGAVATRGE